MKEPRSILPQVLCEECRFRDEDCLLTHAPDRRPPYARDLFGLYFKEFSRSEKAETRCVGFRPLDSYSGGDRNRLWYPDGATCGEASEDGEMRSSEADGTYSGSLADSVEHKADSRKEYYRKWKAENKKKKAIEAKIEQDRRDAAAVLEAREKVFAEGKAKAIGKRYAEEMERQREADEAARAAERARILARNDCLLTQGRKPQPPITSLTKQEIRKLQEATRAGIDPANELSRETEARRRRQSDLMDSLIMFSVPQAPLSNNVITWTDPLITDVRLVRLVLGAVSGSRAMTAVEESDYWYHAARKAQQPRKRRANDKSQY